MRSILVVTSGRADTTPLTPVIRELKDRCILYRVDLENCGLVESIGAVEYWLTKAPDIVLVLGDRYEILAAAAAATVAAVPIAHVHGGESTFGSFDNQIRDAVTKLSHIHFAAAEESAQRIERVLGETCHIYTSGAPGLDNLTDLPPRRPEKYFVCTYHPCTAVEESIEPLLETLDKFPEYEQIWTGVNNDPGSNRIREALGDRRIESYRPRNFVVACRHATAVVGNSSAGIIEAPTLEVPTVNVGRRQEGRLRGPSVLDAEMWDMAIIQAIDKALLYAGPFDNPYGGPGASKEIADILLNVELEGIRVKQ